MKINTDPNYEDQNVSLQLKDQEYTYTIQIPGDTDQFILMLYTGQGSYTMISQDLNDLYTVG